MGKKIVQTAGRNQLGEFAPMFAHLNDDVLFGEVWNSIHRKTGFHASGYITMHFETKKIMCLHGQRR